MDRKAEHEELAKWDLVLWRQIGCKAERGVMVMVEQGHLMHVILLILVIEYI